MPEGAPARGNQESETGDLRIHSDRLPPFSKNGDDRFARVVEGLSLKFRCQRLETVVGRRFPEPCVDVLTQTDEAAAAVRRPVPAANARDECEQNCQRCRVWTVHPRA